MKHKYIEERFPRYFLTGNNGDLVEVSTIDRVVGVLSRYLADSLIDERDRCLDQMIQLIDYVEELGGTVTFNLGVSDDNRN